MTTAGAGARLRPGDSAATGGARRHVWLAVAALAALVPMAGVFSLTRVFYVRDLSLVFWQRNLWLRRSLVSGEWPLWDPYMAGGQSAAADALHQMFLLPVLALRLLGSEIVGFNLWVALAFPLAAIGAFLFFRSRCSPQAASLGAIAFAVAGPVVSTGNFPNMSWSVAAIPWIFWAVDGCLRKPVKRNVALVATAAAFQVLAGEPVTMAATMVTVAAYAAAFGVPATRADLGRAVRTWLAIAAGLALGVGLSAVQVLPLAAAVSGSWRSAEINTAFWSLHPLALVEAVFIHLFGNFFDASALQVVPWMATLNSGREPFFFSIYVGPTLLGLAAFGAAAGDRRWAWFWAVCGLTALFAAFGANTPFYPFLQAHLPLVRSFRFPVKYLVLASFSLAALAAVAWDRLVSDEWRDTAPARWRRSRMLCLAAPASVLAACYLLCVGVFYVPQATNRWLMDLARWCGVRDPGAAASYLLPRLLGAVTPALLLSAGATLFFAIATSRRPERRLGRPVLYGLLAADLIGAAIGINPTLDAAWISEPPWARVVRAHPESRTYFGGEQEGIFDRRDPDAPKRLVPPVELSPSEARAAAANESVLFPAAYGIRAVFSYDLAVLWPRAVQMTHHRFLKSKKEGRERFLSRTAVRYRILPPSAAPGRSRLATLRYFDTASLFDWGSDLTRAFVVADTMVATDVGRQIEAMFEPGLDVHRAVVTSESPSGVVGIAGPPVEPGARIVRESANRVVVEAGAGAAGGYLVLLDSYSPDWRVRIDGQPGRIYTGNVLYRMVPLPPGRHVVDFRFRPVSFQAGLAVSSISMLAVMWLALPRRRRPGSA